MESLPDVANTVSQQVKTAMCIEVIDTVLPTLVKRELISGDETRDILLETRDALVFGLRK